jgi:hypothetical protein
MDADVCSLLSVPLLADSLLPDLRRAFLDTDTPEVQELVFLGM